LRYFFSSFENEKLFNIKNHKKSMSFEAKDYVLVAYFPFLIIDKKKTDILSGYYYSNTYNCSLT